jgi:uncharacterized protein (TIGR02266 family)
MMLDQGESSSSPLDESAVESRPVAPIRLDAKISFASESQFFAGLDGDVSEGGVFIETYRPLPVGTPVDIELELPERRVSAAGCVRWVRDAKSGAAAGVGIELVIVSRADRRIIERFCDRRTPLYYEE